MVLSQCLTSRICLQLSVCTWFVCAYVNQPGCYFLLRKCWRKTTSASPVQRTCKMFVARRCSSKTKDHQRWRYIFIASVLLHTLFLHFVQTLLTLVLLLHFFISFHVGTVLIFDLVWQYFCIKIKSNFSTQRHWCGMNYLHTLLVKTKA